MRCTSARLRVGAPSGWRCRWPSTWEFIGDTDAEPAVQFFTSYLLEKSLSVDNLFLFALIFTSMGVAAEYQHRVLFWGVLGALVMRGVFIVAGVQLVRHFHAVLYVFAVFLIIMGVRLLREQSKKYDPTRSRVIRLARKLFPISEGYEGGRFFTRSAAVSAPRRSFWF